MSLTCKAMKSGPMIIGMLKEIISMLIKYTMRCCGGRICRRFRTRSGT